MPAQLVALNDGPSILLDKPILLLGRHPECDIQIDSRKVSRRHCCIAQVNDYLVVRDLGSTNGIRINGVRVVEGRISPDDELTIGSLRYQVRGDSAASPLSPKPAPRPAVALLKPAAPVLDLEACDEPVPIADPGSLAASAVPPAKPYASPGQDEKRPDRPPSKPASFVLPEHLELAPSSDAFPGGSSPSHHPA